MTGCPNCGGVVSHRERGVLRDVVFCCSCGYSWESTPGTLLRWTAALSAFVLGLAASAQAEATNGHPRQA